MNSGTVIFKPDDKDSAKTEIELHMEYQPEDFKEKAGDVLGVVSRKVTADMKRFKEFIEARGVETGAWKGEIIHGADNDDQSQLRRTGT
jgi:uncharacterized membrane protein